MIDQGQFNEPLDDIVIERFPYPVALAYQRLLETKNPTEQAELCLQTFRFSVRAIAFAIIIQYLLDRVQAAHSLLFRCSAHYFKNSTCEVALYDKLLIRNNSRG